MNTMLSVYQANQFGRRIGISSKTMEKAQQCNELEHQLAEHTMKLQAQNKQTNAILQNMADAVLLMDQDQRIVFVNPAWEKLTGYTANEALKQNAFFLERAATPSSVFQSLSEALEKGEMWRGDLQGQRKDGSNYQIEVSVTPIENETGSITRYVSVQRDVTEARELDALKNRFLADAIHDLANPVASLKISLHLIQRRPEYLTDQLGSMNHVIDHLDALVNDLLVLLRLERAALAADLKCHNFNEIVEQVIEVHKPLAEQKGLKLVFDADASLPCVLADKWQIERMVSNLVSNALNYTPAGGEIYVNTSGDSTGNGNHVVFSVQDTGIGINPAALPYIFERFYRSDEARVTSRGTGLGLSIVKEIVEKHGGRIEAESVPAQGSLFKVYLPAVIQ